VIERDDLVRYLGLQPGCQLEAIGVFFGAPDDAAAAFEALAAEGMVRQTARGMCLLTDSGRARREELYRAEAAACAAGPVVEAYEAFEPINLAFLGWATTWQTRPSGEGDQPLLAQLWEIDAELQPLLDGVSRELPRFGYHQRALVDALKRVEAGENDWLLSPAKASYHTAWFILHQDWLEALGRERED
jgi:hypothetical protein